MDSESKTNTKRKFTVVSKSPNRVHKVLLLECNSERQRNDWVNLLKKEIKNSRVNVKQKSELDEFMEFLSINTEPVCATPPPEGNSEVEEAKNRDITAPAVEKDDITSCGTHLRYQVSENFPNSQFLEDFAPLDDAVSVTSEDTEPYSRMLKSEKYGESMDKLLPIKVDNRSRLEESKESSKLPSSDGKSTPSSRSMTNNESTSRRYNPHSQIVRTLGKSNISCHALDKDILVRNIAEVGTPRSCSNSIIRKENSESSFSDISKILEANSCFTIRLKEF
jgi:hypothetical protein